MSDNPYDPAGAAAAAAAAAAATPPSVPVYQTGNPFAPPADPNAVGGLGMTLGTGRSLMELGANMSAAANARIGGGFLANGTGFLGPLMAGVGQTLQQGQQDVNSRAAYNSVAAQTIGQQLKNREEQMKLPLTAAQTTQNLDWILHPEHAMQYWQQFAAPPPSTAPGTAAPGTGPGASNVSGNSPETASVTPATYGGSGESIANNPKLAPLISQTAVEKGIPPQLAYALFQQESSLGTNPAAGNNVGQVTFKTANNPGYGMQPLSGSDLQDPGKNVAWSLDYFKRAGEANGVTDWSNPQQWGTALRAYNGNGDPAYVEHVARWLPKGMQVYDPGLGDAAKPLPNTASASGQGNAPTGQSKPMVIGDSIGAGLQKAGNLDGTSVQGASPEAVLGTIKTMSPDSVRGRNIILSGGSSNDTTQTAMVADQVRALQAKGAASVSILGVGSRQDFMQARVNQQLRAIADSTGAKFVPLGATGPDNVHPADYAALLTNLQPQPPQDTTPGTQPPYRVAQAGGATAAPGGHGPVASDVGAIQHGQTLVQPSGGAPRVAQTGAPNPFGTQTGTPTPQENAQRQGAIHLQNAQNLTQQAGLLEQQQAQWEQQKAFFTARGIPPFVLPPRPAGDPALFRTQAANEQKTGLDLMTAAPEEAAKQAETITINRTTNDVYRGSTLIAHGGIQREILNNATGNYEWYTVGASDPRTGAILPPIPLGATADIGPKAKQGIDVSTGDINLDRNTIEAENDHVIGTAQNAKAQALQLKQLAPEAFTGPAGDVRAKLRSYVQYVAPQAVSEYFGANADVAQEFKKIALMQAGTEERSTLGAKGGIKATELYLEGNPNLDMNEVANGHMANLLAVQQQAAIDYGTGSSAFYEKSRDEYPTSAAPYQRITAYDNKWNKLFNSNTYSAAMSAMNDRPYATWSKGLSPAQQQTVLGIVQRTDPTQKIDMDGKHGTVDDFIQRGAKIISPEDIIGNNYGIQGKLAPPAGTTNVP